mmetsp:Transcript_1856/g.4225  ORF Transcript_1856/g.4225 Transcript_1856/m.4225 type:complete len:253 (-) Transcript_1856:85-843(-)
MDDDFGSFNPRPLSRCGGRHLRFDDALPTAAEEEAQPRGRLRTEGWHSAKADAKQEQIAASGRLRRGCHGGARGRGDEKGEGRTGGAGVPVRGPEESSPGGRCAVPQGAALPSEGHCQPESSAHHGCGRAHQAAQEGKSRGPRGGSAPPCGAPEGLGARPESRCPEVTESPTSADTSIQAPTQGGGWQPGPEMILSRYPGPSLHLSLPRLVTVTWLHLAAEVLLGLAWSHSLHVCTCQPFRVVEARGATEDT